MPFLDPARYLAKCPQTAVFTEMALKLKFVVSSWPSDLGWLFMHSHWPFPKVFSGCCPWELAQGADRRVGVCVGKVHGVLWVGVGLLRDLWVGPSCGSWAGFLMESMM